jgi:hypothetical protein
LTAVRLLLAAAAALAALVSVPLGAAAGPEQKLANRYAPIVELVDQAKPCEKGEPWRPTTVRIVLGNPEVTLRGPGKGNPVVKRAPTAADLYGKGEGYFLNYPGNPNFPRCTYDRDGKRFARGKPSITYAHIVTQPSGEPGGTGRLALEYWLFYYFNDYNDKHEADWEGIQLVFDADSAREALGRKPVEAGYAQHEGGERASWDSHKLEKLGTHPVVYSAKGSHASYYSSALWLGKSASQGVGCDDTRGPLHPVQLQAGLLPSTVDSRSSPYTWLAFDGRWGQKLPGVNNGPQGPNAKPRWSDPFAWQDSLRNDSVNLPAGETLGTSVTGAFCGSVAFLSSILTFFYNSPTETVVAVVLAVVLILALVIWLVRRTTWSGRPEKPIRAKRTIGEMLRASARLYRKRKWLFLAVGLLSPITFVFVKLLEAGLQAAFSPLGDVSIKLSATAFAALAVNAAVAIALDRLDRGQPVKVLGTYRLVLRRALPLLGAILLEGLVFVVAFVLVLLLPVVITLLYQPVGEVAFLVVVVVALPTFAWLLLGWAFTSQQIYLEGRSPFYVVRQPLRLTRGHWWRVALLLAVLYVVAIATGPIIGVILIVATPIDPRLFDLVGSVVYILVLPYVAISSTLLFFDLKERRDEMVAPATALAVSP